MAARTPTISRRQRLGPSPQGLPDGMVAEVRVRLLVAPLAADLVEPLRNLVAGELPPGDQRLQDLAQVECRPHPEPGEGSGGEDAHAVVDELKGARGRPLP